MGSKSPVIVSACLLGIKSRYNGNDACIERATEAIDALEDRGSYILPVCPEQMGGLETPRAPACIRGGTGEDVLLGTAQVIDNRGRDVTEAFIQGAEAVLWLTRKTKAKIAILKEGSPSCGVNHIYTETSNLDKGAKLREGSGVTAAILRAENLQIIGF